MSGHEDSINPTSSPGDQPEASPGVGTPQSNNKRTGIELTAVEGLLFYNIVRFNNDFSATDWEQVALHSNLKNAASAKVRFRQIQKKYDMENLATSKATPKAPGTQKGGSRKRKAATDDVDNGDNGVVADDTPSKKQPTRKRGAAASGKGNGRARGKGQNTHNATGDKAGAAGDDLAGLRVKEEPGTHDVANTHAKPFVGVYPLTSAKDNVQDAPPFPPGFNFDLNHGCTQPDPFQQAMQQQHGLGRVQNQGHFIHNGYHMAGAQFGQLEADPAGFFGPPSANMNPFVNTAAHSLPHGGRNDQQTVSSRSSHIKEEEHH